MSTMSYAEFETEAKKQGLLRDAIPAQPPRGWEGSNGEGWGRWGGR